MKNYVKKSLALVLMFVTLVSFSNKKGSVSNKKINNPTNLSFENVAEGSTLQIKDKDKYIIYKEIIEISGKYSKNFDMSNLPDAEYFVELHMQDKIVILPFSVKATVATLRKAESREIFKPMVSVQGDSVIISRKLMEEENLKIEVYYEGYDLAYSEKIRDTKNLRRIYDFTGSQKGNYLIVFTSKGRIFTNNISI
ncbi:MAG: hypothetical protein HN704_04690 [Bacteroidetes bacterium]|jgi:hypothetical protein|nr:hypothetical protein [Bacteroidota bacterium]MBT6686009.1 hypothetical protein [Bacteroidota bacterium]MBT7143791.1 hypothetical protein [Bacteroidota bacterium]MBT7490890.1 hypothetical protein [Bacteroidota bacterium]